MKTLLNLHLPKFSDNVIVLAFIIASVIFFLLYLVLVYLTIHNWLKTPIVQGCVGAVGYDKVIKPFHRKVWVNIKRQIICKR